MDKKNVKEPKENVVDGVHNYTAAEGWIRPDDAVMQRLEWFQDQKLALMVHFGLYCEIGVDASWGMSDEDAHWSRTEIDWTTSGERLREDYFGLNRSFNPIRLQPDKWAEFAKENGFRYLILTTKHHDGFCLWDTQTTEYKTTAQDCPYHTSPNADVVKVVFDAFRKKELGIAAYFSKPDWHCPYYWAEGMEKPIGYWRRPTYHPKEYPELWERFVQYTHAQMTELVTRYDPDILWLDGGWVNPIILEQDIRLSEFVQKARKLRPDLIVCDRTVGGENENYITPEQTVPEKPLGIPWESCITLGSTFSYRFESDEDYKTPKELIHLLIDVVCKGGNLALNISPQPDGRFPKKVEEIVSVMGRWLKKYGDSIYRTRVCPPYKQKNVAFTQNAGKVYAIVLLNQEKPACIRIPFEKSFRSLSVVGWEDEVSYKFAEKWIEVDMSNFTYDEVDKIAVAFEINIA